jgi:hypothetical protein
VKTNCNFSIIILFACFLTAIKTIAQDTTEYQHGFSIVPYVGVGVMEANLKIGFFYKREDAKLVGLPVAFGIKSNYIINTNLGFSIDVNYVHKGVGYYEYADFDSQLAEGKVYHNRTTTKVRATLGCSYYYLNTTENQAYVSFNAGVKYVDEAYTIDGTNSTFFFEYPILTGITEEAFPLTTFRLGFGFNHNFSSKMFLATEIGIGSNPIHLGIGIHL